MAVLVSVFFLIILKKTGGQITSNLQDEIKCAGDSVNLNWAYTTNNQIVATWLFGTTTIMSSVAGGTPVVESAYTGRATHGGNGVLTLTGLTTADSGTYSLGVTYSAAPTSVNDQVEVTVYDKITQASTPQCGTDTVTCGSASMSGVSYSWKVGNAVVPQVSWSISLRSGTNTYECTISGNRVTNCLDAGVGTTQSTNCTLKEETTSVHGTSPSNLDTTETITQSSGGMTSKTDITLSRSETVTMDSNTVTTNVLFTTRRDLDVDDELLIVVISSLVGGIILVVILALLFCFLIKKKRASSNNPASNAEKREGRDNIGIMPERYSNNHKEGRSDQHSNSQRVHNYKPKAPNASHSVQDVNSGNHRSYRYDNEYGRYGQSSGSMYSTYNKINDFVEFPTNKTEKKDGFLLYN